MRKILVSTIFLLILCVSANANIVYTTTSGDMGLIKVSSSTSADLAGIQYTNASSDTLLGSYWDGENVRIILLNRAADPEKSSGDKALVFRTSNLTTPINSEAKTLVGVYNAQAAAGSYNGRRIYFASDASIREFDTESFSQTNSYTNTPASGDTYTPALKSLISSRYRLYCLLDRENLSTRLLGFDGQLKENVQSFVNVNISADASCISWLSKSRVAAGHSEGVSIWGLNGFYQVISTDLPVKALCQDGGNGFYFAEQGLSGDVVTTTLKHYHAGDKTVTEIYSDDSGTCYRLLRDDVNWILAAVIGGKIVICSMTDDSITAEYGSESLGGLPLNVATTHVTGDDGDISSGCNFAGAGGVIMLLACLFLKRR